MKTSKKINVVCFGGGTGLPSLLRGLKTIPDINATAVVNMFDTGGSSGELRDKFGILPPGDILKCLLALAEDDVSARKVLLKRIPIKKSHIKESEEYSGRLGVPQNVGGFVGHTGGNVLLMGLERVYGDYLDAVGALGQVLSIRGKVIPVTLTQGTLCARYKDGFICRGEVDVDGNLFAGREIDELFLEPEIHASLEAEEAIRNADAFCIGPGSFYTSVMPNFLPKGIKREIVESKAPIIFICNLLTEGDGMRGFTVEYITEILENCIGRKTEVIVVNAKIPDRKILNRYKEEKKHPLLPNLSASDKIDSRFVIEDLWLDPGIARHDSWRLASVVSKVLSKMIK